MFASPSSPADPSQIQALRDAAATAESEIAQAHCLLAQKQHELEMQEQANMWKKQTQDYDQSEQKKREMARRRNLDQQKWLKKQIIDKANSAGMCDQSALELQMNRSILRKVRCVVLGLLSLVPSFPSVRCP